MKKLRFEHMSDQGLNSVLIIDNLDNRYRLVEGLINDDEFSLLQTGKPIRQFKTYEQALDYINND